jgi:hypothetical protein
MRIENTALQPDAIRMDETFERSLASQNMALSMKKRGESMIEPEFHTVTTAHGSYGFVKISPLPSQPDTFSPPAYVTLNSGDLSLKTPSVYIPKSANAFPSVFNPDQNGDVIIHYTDNINNRDNYTYLKGGVIRVVLPTDEKNYRPGDIYKITSPTGQMTLTMGSAKFELTDGTSLQIVFERGMSTKLDDIKSDDQQSLRTVLHHSIDPGPSWKTSFSGRWGDSVPD